MGRMSSVAISELLIKLVKRAGNLLKSNINKNHKILFKGSASNIVTEMDKAVESLFIKNIKQNFPGHEVVSEEMSGIKGYIKPVMPIEKGYRWIIDPLDGTTNYAHGFPHFCVSAAIEKNGHIIMGAVYNPMLREFFYAKKKSGAWMNDQRIRVSKNGIMEEALLATGFPYDFKTSKMNNVDNFVNVSRYSRAVRRAGSAALDLCDVACGRFDGFWEMKLQPWDIAAGALMVEEAGGRWTGFDGKSISLYHGKIIASNGIIHGEMTNILKNSRY